MGLNGSQDLVTEEKGGGITDRDDQRHGGAAHPVKLEECLIAYAHAL